MISEFLFRLKLKLFLRNFPIILTDDLKTNISSIDIQHKKLINQLNNIYYKYINKTNGVFMIDVFQIYIGTLEAHFNSEEAELSKLFGSLKIIGHKKYHDNLVDNILTKINYKVLKNYEHSISFFGMRNILEFLRREFMIHIKSDIKLINKLNGEN